jgi:basic membrane protein A
MKKVLLALLVGGLVVTMLGIVPAGASHDINGTVCLVADPHPAGFDDSGFNGEALAGAEEAGRKLHTELVTAEPALEAAIAPIVEAWVTSEICDLIIGVGFRVGAELELFVAGYPLQRFMVIDYVFPGNPANAVSVIFQVDQPGFLAGYVAAASSQTGRVGTFGGLQILPVTDYMDGFALGVEYYNSRYGASVEVLGWDPVTAVGLFVGFGDPAAARAVTADLFDSGADSVFALAGEGSGSYEEAAARKAVGESVRVVFADVDAFEIFERDPARVLLTSAVKVIDDAVYRQVEALVGGTWESGVVVEDLASGGIDIAPFHKTNNQVPGFVRNDLREIRTGIIDGTIPTLP